MKSVLLLLTLSITTCVAENNGYQPYFENQAYENNESNIDTLIIEFIDVARIRNQMEATFDAILERFGGNISQVRADMAEEMGKLGMSSEEVSARLRLMEDYSKRLAAAKDPLISRMLEELVSFYRKNFSTQEIRKLISFYKDPTMLKFQQQSLGIMPEILEEVHSQTMELAKPHLEEMQAKMKQIDDHYGRKNQES